MTEFTGVTVVIPANVYFNGGCTSRTVIFADGSKKTLGIMLPGEYEFSTGAPELVEITAGKLDVKLPGESEWKPLAAGESFHVAGNAKFHLRVHELMDYVCSFLAE